MIYPAAAGFLEWEAMRGPQGQKIRCECPNRVHFLLKEVMHGLFEPHLARLECLEFHRIVAATEWPAAGQKSPRHARSTATAAVCPWLLHLQPLGYKSVLDSIRKEASC